MNAGDNVAPYYHLFSLTAKWFVIYTHWKTFSNYLDYLLMFKMQQCEPLQDLIVDH